MIRVSNPVGYSTIYWADKSCRIIADMQALPALFIAPKVSRVSHSSTARWILSVTHKNKG